MTGVKTLSERLKALQLERAEGNGVEVGAVKDMPKKGLRKLSNIGRAILRTTADKKPFPKVEPQEATSTQQEQSQSEAPSNTTGDTYCKRQTDENANAAPRVLPPDTPQQPQESEVQPNEKDETKQQKDTPSTAGYQLRSLKFPGTRRRRAGATDTNQGQAAGNQPRKKRHVVAGDLLFIHDPFNFPALCPETGYPIYDHSKTIDIPLEGRSTVDQHDFIRDNTPTAAHVCDDRGPGDIRKCRFRLRRKIGSGAYGSVYLMRDKATKFPCAVKICRKTLILPGQWLQREVRIHCQLNHPYIIRYYGHWQDIDTVSLVLEYCPGGSLFEYLQARPQKIIPEDQAALYVWQLASALQYLHLRNILHRDVKLENILIDEKGDVKLCDFGWAVHGGISGRRRSFHGTVDYRAPESWGNVDGVIEYDNRVDIWALGCVMFDMLCGRPAFVGQGGQLARNIIKCQYRVNSNVSGLAVDLIQQILVRNPAMRIPLEEIMEHLWILENTQLEDPDPEECQQDIRGHKEMEGQENQEEQEEDAGDESEEFFDAETEE